MATQGKAGSSVPELMLCQLVAEPFDDPGWIFEPKLDGLRVLCEFDGRQWTLTSRNGKRQDVQFPDVLAGLRGVSKRPVALDGEIVCLDEDGRPSFRVLQQRFHLLDEEVIAERARRYPAHLYVFDILRRDGQDLRPMALEKRKKYLRDTLRYGGRIAPIPWVKGEGTALLAAECAKGGEGIVGKRLGSAYVAARTGDWVKIKCSGRQEFVIGGFTDPQRSRVGIGALLVGYYEKGKLRYAGKVGTGYTRAMLTELRERLGRIERAGCPFVGQECPRSPGVHWVAPRLVAEVGFAEWTQNGLLRQPRFEGLREDKPAKTVRRERAGGG